MFPVRVSPDSSNLFDTVDDKLDTVLLIVPVVVHTVSVYHQLYQLN